MEQSVPLDPEEREKLDSFLNRARKNRAVNMAKGIPIDLRAAEVT